MARTVNVNLGTRTYSIHIGTGVLPGASLAEEKDLAILVVSDSNVAPLYAPKCAAALRELGLEVHEAVVPAGEQSKSLDCAAKLYASAIEAGLDRRSVVVAVGGGVVGDLAGFVAATYLRGVRLIQVPTSLLAMVDSSVGGKTAVDLPQGKNLVGAFHQPIEVAVDLSALATLPERDYISGLAEVVKYGVIWDASLFRDIEDHAESILARDPDVLERLITRCCEIKAEVVAMDERESGVRAVLNFGHTCGHALEQASAYETWLHGETLSLGMVYAAGLSMTQRGFAAEQAARLVALLGRLGLPVDLRQAAGRFSWQDVRVAMAADKKARGRIPRLVLADELGAVVYDCEVPEQKLEEAWCHVGGN